MTDVTKSLVGPITTSREVSLWRNSVLPLAVESATPLLASAGLPIQVAQDPGALTRHALDLIEQLDDTILSAGNAGPGGASRPTPEEVAQVLISDWVGDLTIAYGGPLALETLAWIFRNHVDWTTRERNWAWWRWIGAVHRRAADVPVHGDADTAIRDLIDRAFVLAKSPSYAELELRVARLPRTNREAEVLRRWTDPDGPGEFDYVGALRLARLREIARAVSGILVASLDSADLRFVTEAQR